MLKVVKWFGKQKRSCESCGSDRMIFPYFSKQLIFLESTPSSSRPSKWNQWSWIFFFLSWNFLGRKTRQAKNWCVDKSIRSLMAEKEWLEIQLTCDIGGAIMVARDDGAFPTKWGAIWDPLESSKSQGSQHLLHLLVCWNVLFFSLDACDGSTDFCWREAVTWVAQNFSCFNRLVQTAISLWNLGN